MSTTVEKNIYSFASLRSNLLDQVDCNNPDKQKEKWKSSNAFRKSWEKTKATVKNDMDINCVRNEIGQLFHGNDSDAGNLFTTLNPIVPNAEVANAQQKEIPHVENEQVVNAIDKLKSHFQEINHKLDSQSIYKQILANLKNYCREIVKIKTNKPEDIYRASALFFQDLLKYIPTDLKEKAELNLKEMIHCSAHFINGVDTPEDERKNFIHSFLEASETFVNMLLPSDEGANLSAEARETFKNILLVSVSYAGMLLTYEKRGAVNKGLLFVFKKAFVPFAYLLNCLLGTTIGRSLTTTAIATGITAIGITCTFFPPIILGVVGMLAGLALTKLLEWSFNWVFKKVAHNINKNIQEKVVLNRAARIGVEYTAGSRQTTSDNELEMKEKVNPFRTQAKQVVFKGNNAKLKAKNEEAPLLTGKDLLININSNHTKSARTIELLNSVNTKLTDYKNSVSNFLKRARNNFTKQQLPLLNDLQTEIVALFESFNIDDKKILDELFFLLHTLVNCSEEKSEKALKSEFTRIVEILNKIVPQDLAENEKNMILESALLIIFNARPMSTAALRNAYVFVYVFTDLITDQLGDFAVPAITHGAVNFGIDLTLNTALGIPIIALGISIFLAIMKYTLSRDKEEVFIPNLYVLKHVENHLNYEKKKIEYGIELRRKLMQSKMPTTEAIKVEANTKVVEVATSFKGTPDEILLRLVALDTVNSKFLTFKVDSYDVKLGEYTVHYEYVDSLTLVPGGYLSYPFTESRLEVLKEQLKEIEKELANIHKYKRKKEIEELAAQAQYILGKQIKKGKDSLIPSSSRKRSNSFSYISSTASTPILESRSSTPDPSLSRTMSWSGNFHRSLPKIDNCPDALSLPQEAV